MHAEPVLNFWSFVVVGMKKKRKMSSMYLWKCVRVYKKNTSRHSLFPYVANMCDHPISDNFDNRTTLSKLTKTPYECDKTKDLRHKHDTKGFYKEYK